LNAGIFKFIINRILRFGVVGKILQGREYLDLKYPVVYVANHQSTMDMLMMAYAMPKRTVFMVKKQLGWVPIMGQFLIAGKNVFLDRGNRQNALDSMNKVGLSRLLLASYL
jgi:1-acyl-sn-glycerol-3-phosphate acyltransferase